MWHTTNQTPLCALGSFLCTVSLSASLTLFSISVAIDSLTADSTSRAMPSSFSSRPFQPDDSPVQYLPRHGQQRPLLETMDGFRHSTPLPVLISVCRRSHPFSLFQMKGPGSCVMQWGACNWQNQVRIRTRWAVHLRCQCRRFLKLGCWSIIRLYSNASRLGDHFKTTKSWYTSRRVGIEQLYWVYPIGNLPSISKPQCPNLLCITSLTKREIIKVSRVTEACGIWFSMLPKVHK